MRQTDLAAALIQWEILHALAPDNDEFSRQLKATQASIQERAHTHLRLGQRAFKRGNFRRAKREFLLVLALDPRQSQPWTALRTIEKRHLETWQRANLAKLAKATNKTAPRQAQDNHQPRQDANTDGYHLERGLTRFRQGDLEASIRELHTYLTTSPESQKAKQYLAAAHFQLGRSLYRQGNMTEALTHFEAAGKTYPSKVPQINLYIQQIKNTLANNYYRKGLQIYRTDLAKAIQFWQVALSYNPQHTRAHTRLENAYQLRHMLQQFEGK